MGICRERGEGQQDDTRIGGSSLGWGASHDIGKEIQNSEQKKRNNGDDEEHDIHYGLAFIDTMAKGWEYFGWELWDGAARD